MRRLTSFNWRFLLIGIFLFPFLQAFGQTCSTSASGSSNWSTTSWSCSGVGSSSPTTNGGTYSESITINGLGNGETFYVDISLTLSGGNDLTINASGSNPTFRVLSGRTLRITGDIINSNNNVNFYVEAGAFLIIDGTLNGNNNNLFGGPGTISGGSLVLGNNAGCVGGDCPTISFPTCSATGTFCADNNSACIKTNTISGATTICSGSSPTLTATAPTAGSGSYTYRWESSTTSSSSGFGNAPGSYTTSSNSYSPGVLTQTTWFRRVVTDAGATPACQQPNTSNVIQVTVNPNVAINSHPSNVSQCASTAASFTVGATGTSLTYQWQINTSGTWSNITNGGIYTNATTATLNISSVSAGMHGYQYRAVVSGTCGAAQTSNAATLSVSGSSGGWLGTTSTAWSTSTNWCGGVPTSTTDVTIASGPSNMPLVSSAAAVTRDLTLNSGCTLTVNGNTLTINGNLVVNSGGALVITSNTVTVNGSVTVNSGGTITITSPGGLTAKGAVTNNGTISGTGILTLNGSSSQNIGGASGTFGNVALNNGSGCVATTAITISGYLTLTSGAFNSSGNLTVNLSTGGISYVASETGSITGNVNYTKSIPSAKYHYLSSPFLSGADFSQWNDDVTITLGPQYKNLYYYDETSSNNDKLIGWTAVPSLLTLIAPVKGYAMYFNGSTTLDMTGSYTHGTDPSSVTLTNTVSSGADTDADGWNLVGNPFPSTINWSAGGWTKTNIDNSIYFCDPSNDRYASFVGGLGTNGGTQYIPAMQAFWVKVNVAGGTGTLRMTNPTRTTTNTGPSLWRVAVNRDILRLSVKGANTISDESIIRFSADATEAFDSDLDAHKLENEGNVPSLFTRMDGDYSINTLPSELESITIPVHVKILENGIYTLKINDIENFDPSYVVLLEDRLSNVSQDLRSNDSYTFLANTSDTSGRFLLHLTTLEVLSNKASKAAGNVRIFSFDHSVYCNVNNTSSASDANIEVVDMLGKPVASVPGADLSSGQIRLDFPEENGLYIVKISIGQEVYSQKVILK